MRCYLILTVFSFIIFLFKSITSSFRKTRRNNHAEKKIYFDNAQVIRLYPGEIIININFVRLDGSDPQKKRLGLVSRFQKEPDCRFFITTNAGSTGLNLQAANTVINVDLPWNPAILEQRIGRAHRMGQKRPVQIFLLVTEDTIEENLLGTLSAKQALFNAALGLSCEADSLDLSAGIDELRRRMEVLIGEKPDAPVDESVIIASLSFKHKNSTMLPHIYEDNIA